MNFLKPIGRHPLAIAYVGSVTGLLALWYATSLWVGGGRLPPPQAVLGSLIELIASGEAAPHLAATALLVVKSFFLSLVLGVILGCVAGTSRIAEAALAPFVFIGLSVPVLAWATLGIMWFGLNSTSAVLAISAVVTPFAVVNVIQGMRSIDWSLIEMARTYRASRWLTFHSVLLPQLAPILLGTARFCFSQAWKATVVVEMLGLSRGVGYMLTFWYGLYSMTNVLAWTGLFAAFIVIFDVMVFRPFDLWLRRWRSIPQ